MPKKAEQLKGVKMKDLLYNYFDAKGDARTAEDYMAFDDWAHDKRQYSEDLTSRVYANIDLKKAMAKKIVSDMMNDRDYYNQSSIMDKRLRALVTYYFSIELYSGDPQVAESAVKAIAHYRSKHNQISVDMSGIAIVKDPSDDAIVIMRPWDDLYRGYRMLVVNMLCFTSSRFVLGFRTDGGPVRGPMKYYKGCRPAGIGRAKDGTEWNLIQCDTSLSDDNLAIISNALDGDGTIEMCDWISDKIQRIIFRTNY